MVHTLPTLPTVLLIIPAFNEIHRIHATLETVLHYFENTRIEYQILVVDDGSTDGTGQLVRGLTDEHPKLSYIRLPQNRGKGYAVRHGMLTGKGQYLIFSDADLSTPIEESAKLVEALEKGADVAIASRGLPTSHIEIHQGIMRETLGKLYNGITRWILPLPFTDTQCGFKAFRQEVADRLFREQRLTGFAFDVEVLYLAQQHGYKIQEVPVRWKNDRNSRVHCVRDGVRMLLDLLKIRLIHGTKTGEAS